LGPDKTEATLSFPPNYFGPVGVYSLSSSGGVGSCGQPITKNGSPIGPDDLRVEDGCGNPIAGALVKLYDVSDVSFAHMLANASTFADGRWSGMTINTGSYNLVISAPGDQSVTVPIIVP
jgi:hypothetical protein